MTICFLIPTILFLACLAVRCLYELLKEAHKINSESKPIFAAMLMVMCILWVSWFNLCPLDPYQVGFPNPIRWFGFAIFAVGMVLAVGALIQLRGVENIGHLVTTGLFKKVRHPMYVGFIAWILGWSIFHSALVSLSIGLIGILSILWWMSLEEGRLEKQFGGAYKQYRLTTWF
jgi:protein-S-isoprenylcysteine O-methyltransferase Ste14